MKQKLSTVLVATAIIAAFLVAIGFFAALMCVAEAEDIPL